MCLGVLYGAGLILLKMGYETNRYETDEDDAWHCLLALMFSLMGSLPLLASEHSQLVLFNQFLVDAHDETDSWHVLH